jgi:DNA-binding response OmpR family regulator
MYYYAGMNGLTVLKVTKEHKDKQVRNIPIFMLTGVGNMENYSYCKKMGALDYSMKPFQRRCFCSN